MGGAHIPSCARESPPGTREMTTIVPGRVASCARTLCASPFLKLLLLLLLLLLLSASTYLALPTMRPQPLASSTESATPCAPPTNAPWRIPNATAIVIDSNFTALLNYSIAHMLLAAPSSWVLVLIHTQPMRDSVHRAFSGALRSGKLHAWEIAPGGYGLSRGCWDADGTRSVLRDVLPWPRTASGALSERWPERDWTLQGVQTLTTLYETVPTEKLLVFQADSALCTGGGQRLYDYWGVDYIGAAWPFSYRELGVPSPRDIYVGNGGFSLRSRSVMLRILARYGTGAVVREAEDGFLSARVTAVGGVLATLEQAGAFCAETMLLDEAPAGFHKPWMYLGAHNLLHLAKHCPALLEMARLANQEQKITIV